MKLSRIVASDAFEEVDTERESRRTCVKGFAAVLSRIHLHVENQKKETVEERKVSEAYVVLPLKAIPIMEKKD